MDADTRAIVRCAPDAYLLLDPTLRIVELSDAYARATLVARDDVVGQLVLDVFLAHPDEPDAALAVRAGFARALAERRPIAHAMRRYSIRRPEGGYEVRYWSSSTTPILRDDGSVAYLLHRAEDITAGIRHERYRDLLDSERTSLEAAARVLADRLRSPVGSIEASFALFDADDRLVLANQAFAELVHAADPALIVGHAYEALLDGWLGDVDVPDEQARAAFRANRLAQRNADTSTFDVRLRDGRALRVTDRRTGEGGIVKTIWDLTDDEQRARELRDARAAAVAASAAKSDFLSSMSHELRTPLNGILGFAQLLLADRREPLSPRHRERTEHIVTGGEHLLRLINDILDFSRIEAGRMRITLEPVAIADVLGEVCDTLQPVAARQGIALELPPLPPELPRVTADRMRFVQILMNFGSNAVKYNRSGGLVRFEVARLGEHVRVTVADTGPGIALAQQPTLFQAFQRAGQEAGPIEGTGIGLVIAKQLAELMRGAVGFQSAPGEGSAFWVELPVG